MNPTRTYILQPSNNAISQFEVPPKLRITPRGVVVSGILGSIYIAIVSAIVIVFNPPLVLWLPFTVLAIIVPTILSYYLGRRFQRHIHELELYAGALAKENAASGRRQKKMHFFESIVQDSTDIIFTIDHELLVFKCNRGAESHFGWSQTEVLGRPFSGFFTDSVRIANIIATLTKNGAVKNEEAEIITRDGTRKRISLSIAPMKYESEAISGYVVTAKDITQLKLLEQELISKNEQLNRLAITDSLTGLFNVRHFYDQIRRELKRSARGGDNHPLSLIYIDVDHFKELNDTEGHQMGDNMLHGLGGIIGVCIRTDIDAGFRYGGDEFVILLPDTAPEQADVVAKRIAKQFGAFKFGRTTLSIGITAAKFDDSPESFVKRADEAMYSAKESGRARVVIA